MGTFVQENPLVLLIVGAEVAFWVVLLSGLATRYVLRWRATSTALLVCVPLVDLVLIGASLADLARGTPPGPVHGVAAVYLGFTVAFGPSIVRWADVRFAHRYAGGPPPRPNPRGGPARLRHEWRSFGRVALGSVITVAVTAAMALVAGSGFPPPSEWIVDPLWTWPARVAVVVVIWFVAGPLWASLFPGPDDRESAGVR